MPRQVSRSDRRIAARPTSRRRSSIRLALALAASALGSCSGQPCARPPEQTGIRLATWNIEHLAERDHEGCRPRSEADYAALRLLVDATFDRRSVVALQEIESAAAARRVFPADRFDVVTVDQDFPAPSDPCSDAGGDARLRLPQRVGFAIGKDVRFAANPDLDGLDTTSGNGWPLREGADITVETAGGPVRLLAVHLKAGCPRTDGAGPDCEVLYTQIAPLEGWVEARAAAGEPFVVLGDLNRRLSFPDPSFWEQVDDGQPLLDLQIAARDLVPGARQRCPSHDGAPFIDHFVLSQAVASRYVPGSFRQVPTTTSDHCPVVVELR